MGVLDELEQEAARRKASDEDAAQRKAEREQTYRTVLEPAMADLHDFLARLIANLKVVQPKTALRYQVPGYGTVVGYVEHEYELKEDRQPSAKEILLRFPCAISNAECPTVEVQGASRVRTVSGLFQRHHLGGLLEPRKDASGEVIGATFKARGRIALSAQFRADAESSQLRMNFVNFDDLGGTAKSVPPEQVGQALYEEIGRYLMREPNNLLREDLPEDYREQLREKIRQEEIRRRWETRIAAQQQEDLERLRRAHGVAGKVGRLVDQVRDIGGLGGALGKLRGLVGKDRE